MKREVNYKEMYRKLRAKLNRQWRSTFVSHGKVLDWMTEIRKQCTKRKDLPGFDDMKGIFRNKKEKEG